MSIHVDITVDTDMHALASEFVNAGLVALESTYTEEMVPFSVEQRALWPVDTGYSAGRFHAIIKRTASFVFKMSIVNDAEYVPWVKVKKWGNKTAATAIWFRPAEKLTDRMLDRIADQLSDEVA